MSGTHISDVNLLEDLINEFNNTSDSMLTIDSNVCNHLNNVLDELQNKLNFIQSRLSQAETALSQAESAMNACHASQAAAAAAGIMGPSCTMEENAVQEARAEVAKWRERAEIGQQIVAQCQQEINDYHSGGQQLIQNMCGGQTSSATQQLRECIEKLHDILAVDMNCKLNPAMQNHVENLSDKSSANDSRFDTFRDIIHGGKGNAGEMDEVSRARLRPMNQES